MHVSILSDGKSDYFDLNSIRTLHTWNKSLVCLIIEDVNEMHCCAQVMYKNKTNYNITIYYYYYCFSSVAFFSLYMNCCTLLQSLSNNKCAHYKCAHMYEHLLLLRDCNNSQCMDRIWSCILVSFLLPFAWHACFQVYIFFSIIIIIIVAVVVLSLTHV